MVTVMVRPTGSFSTSKGVTVVRSCPMSEKFAAVTWLVVSWTDVILGASISSGMLSVRVASNASVGLDGSCSITMV